MTQLFTTPLLIAAFCGSGAPLAARPADDMKVEPILASSLTYITLPPKTFRVTPVPDEVNQILKTLVKTGGENVRQGDSEVLLWTGDEIKRDAQSVKQAVITNLKEDGWECKEVEKDKANTVVSLTRVSPYHRAAVGFWVRRENTLVFALTEMVQTTPDTPGPVTPPLPRNNTSTSQSGSLTEARPGTIQVSPTQRTVNIMGNAMPTLPTFTRLAPRRGVVRGYVKDTQGHPLKGAVIGVRSSSAGGFYSGASAKSDAEGYYEVAVPWGAAEFYTASCTLDYGSGRAAFGLYPADGEVDGFASAPGLVKNWVLLPYGVADRDKASDDPKYSGNYFGGTFVVDYVVADPRFSSNTDLPEGAEIELTLVPAGPLLDGSKGKVFTLRRRVQDGLPQFYINNVPVGQYRLSAWLIHNGKPSTLKIRETGPYSQQPFGLEPKEGEAVALTFRPGSAATGKAPASHGNWAPLSIQLSR